MTGCPGSHQSLLFNKIMAIFLDFPLLVCTSSLLLKTRGDGRWPNLIHSCVYEQPRNYISLNKAGPYMLC